MFDHYEKPSDLTVPDHGRQILTEEKEQTGRRPEIEMPKPDNATNVIPDEVPRTDGPGGN